MSLLHPLTPTTDALAEHLLWSLTAPYSRIWLRVWQVGFVQLSEIRLFLPEAPERVAARREPEDELLTLADSLKQELHQEPAGTWLTLDVLVERTGDYETAADFSGNPLEELQEAAFLPEDFQTELALYPRSSTHSPDWLSSYLR